MMQSSSITTEPLSSTASTTTAKRKKKKRKKSNSNIASCDYSANNDTTQKTNNGNNNQTILNSNLSLKKRLYLKKSAKQTPWYDSIELLNVGKGLLLALKLFPSPSHSIQQPSAERCSDFTANKNYNDTAQLPSQQQQSSSSSSQEQPILAGLTNDEYNQLQHALHRVALWKGRSDRGGRISHAIDMTAGLAGILLMDAQRSSLFSASTTNYYNNYSSTSSLYQLRNAYSTILLRSVNGLADTYRHQKKSTTLSVSHCCALAGLPLWIVDIRHDASHNDLPTLNICRIGALESLKFWMERYWNCLEEKVLGKNKKKKEKMMNDMNGGSDDREILEEEGGIYTNALDCLVRYQNVAMVEAREQAAKKKKKGQLRYTNQQNVNGDLKMTTVYAKKEEEDDDDDDDDGGGDMISIPLSAKEGKPKLKKNDKKEQKSEEQAPSPSTGRITSGGSIPWWILNDDKPKKKRKKNNNKEANCDNPAGEGNISAMANTTRNSIALDTKQSSLVPGDSSAVINVPILSTRDCAAEFIRIIPIDVVFTVALQFLVWGGFSVNELCDTIFDNELTNGRTISNGPALLTFPPEMATQSHPMKAKQDYDLLFEECLRTMYEPLLIAIAKSYPGFVSALFLHFADSLLCLDGARQNELRGHAAHDDAIDLKQLENHIEYISRWMEYMLSRAFHMHFDRTVAIFAPEAVHKSEVADSLLQIAEPLSDSGKEKQDVSPQPVIDLKKKGRKKWTPVQLEYMQSPLDYSSLKEIGFPLNSVCDRLLCHNNYVMSFNKGGGAVIELQKYLENIIGKERVLSMGLRIRNETGKSDIAPTMDKSNDTTNLVSKNFPVSDTSNILSLEDMEAMLDVDAGTEKKDAITITGCVSTYTHSPDKPWTLCKSWDACAIGTMPGYPS